MKVGWCYVGGIGGCGKTSHSSWLNLASWGLALSCCNITHFLLTRAGRFTNNSACNMSNCWQYTSAVIVSPGFSSWKWIMPPQSHQTHNNTFFKVRDGFGVGMASWFGESYWQMRFLLLYKTHFSSPVTTLVKNGSFRCLHNKDVQIIRRCSLFIFDNWCGTHIFCL